MREGEVGRNEDGDHDVEARGLTEERPVSADRLVGLGVLTAHAADK